MSLPPDDRDEDEAILDETAYVIGSRYRVSVLETLSSQPSTPTQIAEKHDIAVSHTSRALSELSERNIVQSHSGGSRSKLFSLTSRGERVIDMIDEIGRGKTE